MDMAQEFKLGVADKGKDRTGRNKFAGMKHVIHWLGLLMFIPAFLAAQEVEVKREREFTGSGLYGFYERGERNSSSNTVSSKLVARDVVYEGQGIYG